MRFSCDQLLFSDPKSKWKQVAVLLHPNSMSALLAIAGVQGSAVAGASILRSQESLLRRKLPYLVSVAVGVLLATALLHLLPESIEALGNHAVVWALVGGTMLSLFFTERIFSAITGTDPEQTLDAALAIPHSHSHGHVARKTRPANLMLASALHSFLDGATIATAFAITPRIGWLTALAVALHEIPHRIGDFALLLHLQIPIGRALRFVALIGLPAFLGLEAVLLLGQQEQSIRWLLPVSSGSFLYIACVNLMPELQSEFRPREVLLQLACVAAGVGLVSLVAGWSPV